ncbi:hypothetical protein Taro_047958 [Colocasia esculenta]|uniref:Uncharacterized protein n=1 Tax=Colocasia esculenta TaxID=4460 RepID=A0A843X826_COLES|nr:hypothetical protein [Colocasia esculenta]
MGRAPCCEKVGLKRGRWTAEEDEKLMNYIKANGEGSWRSLPKNAGLLRCGKSCRLRWINYLRADLKRGNISAEEEETIIKLHTSLGNRWSLIAAHLPGRTDNEIKNYWNSHLSRRIHSFKRADGEGGAVIMDLGKIVGIPCKRRGGRTSRSAMKKSNGGTVAAPPTAKCRHAHGGAVLPSDEKGHGGAEGSGSDCGGGHGLQPPCGVALPAGTGTAKAQSSSSSSNNNMLAHDEPLGEEALLVDVDQLLPNEFWETTKALASELFSPCDDMGGDVWVADEHGVGEGSTEQERDRPGAGDVVLDAVPAGEQPPFPQASEMEECNSAVTMDRWADMELEEMASKLWDEAGEEWPWQNWEETAAAPCGSGELHLAQQQPPVPMGGFCGYSDGDIHSWLLFDSLYSS